MITKLHVGNISEDTKNEELERLFSQFGTVRSAEVVTRRLSGRSKGFAYVEMSNDEEAEAAVTALNGKEFQGAVITVAPARPRESRSFGGYQGGGRGRSW